MDFSYFKAICPFEIGDKVRFADSSRVHMITDICCRHYVKSGLVEFRYELDGDGVYRKIVLASEVKS